MLVFVLILLLLAAITGVLGTVLKVTAILFLSVLLTVVLLIAFGWWWFKRRMRQYATGERGAPGYGPPNRPPGGGNVVDTEGHIKRDELPD